MQKGKGLIKRILGKVKKDKVVKALPVVGAIGLISAGSALAGVVGEGGGETDSFSTIFDTLQSWSQGGLGKSLALASLLVGGGYGVVTQSAKAAVTGVALSLVLNYGPSVVDSIFTAVF